MLANWNRSVFLTSSRSVKNVQNRPENRPVRTKNTPAGETPRSRVLITLLLTIVTLYPLRDKMYRCQSDVFLTLKDTLAQVLYTVPFQPTDPTADQRDSDVLDTAIPGVITHVHQRKHNVDVGSVRTLKNLGC